MRTSILVMALWVFAFDIAAPSSLAAERASWKAGLAKTRITPDKPLWMGGFGARTNVSQGTLQELYAKALALDDGSHRPAVLVTTDLVGFRAAVSKNIAERAEKQYGLPRARLILSSSHTHSGPLLADPLSIWYRWRLSAEQYRDVEDYTRELEDKVVAVVGAALRDLQPARLSLGYGEATFGVNRRRKAEKGGAVSFVPNPEGPVDPHVPVLRVDSEQGRLRGVVFGYACHTSTLLADNYRFCGDYAGFAEAWLEQQHPDMVALFVQGCGADIMASPRGTVELARQYGETLGTCAAQVLDGAMRPPLQCAFEVFPLAFAPPPSREELVAQTVFIPGETEIDLTARIYIEQLLLEVPAGVTLAGERGSSGSRGALLTSDALKTPVMIRAGGPDVRITGLRIQGPCPKRYLDHHRRSFGPGGGGSTYYYKFPTSDGITTQHPRLEVDNCEISAFAHAGISLGQGDGHRIHHNFIHHCQYNGLGYGVSHDRASSLIECNRFDWNRHSLAGTGRPGCSYVARNNVELGESLSHCFDMHGGRDRQDGTDVAGTTIEIYNNTFRAPQPAVVIRGVPEEKCNVHHNWFLRHAQAQQAVRAAAKTHTHDNAYGAEPKVVP